MEVIAILENGTSMRYKSISDDTNILVDALLNNQDFLKWIAYLEPNPSSMPYVPPKHILKNRLVLTKFNESILIENEVKVFLYYLKSIPNRNSLLIDNIYEVHIVLPNDYSFIYEYRLNRLTEIARRIAISLDQQRLTGIGEVKINANDETYKINETYVGMTLFITVINGSIKEIV